MNLFVNLITLVALIFESISGANVCTNQQCKCSKTFTTINCDGKGWATLDTIEFPSNVATLTLINNKLKFDTIDDRSKIENLTSLSDLSLNQNPMGTIPAFNDSKIRSLSLQDTSLISAQFPQSYMNSILQTISLSNNKIPSIAENDFATLRYSPVKKLHIDSVSLSNIEQNAFTPLIQLQALSLQNNKLKSCEFLSALPLLSSIKLDGNQFTSLPQQLASPNNIKTFSFTHNSISVIDESSPLHTWRKMNYTNMKIYLANNSFDCCQSLWFIRFLNSSSKFVGDAPLLTCATPTNYAGKQLIKLNPDEMNCGGIIPSKAWWTTGRIIGVTVGGSAAVLALIIVIVILARRGPSRSGYSEIGGIDVPASNAPLSSSNERLFPPHGEDDDSVSAYSTAFTRHTTGSQAPTVNTSTGVSAFDDNRI